VPSKDPILRLEDILENISRIEAFTAGMDGVAFVEDLKTSNATERCLERISEAAKKLGDLAEQLCPGIAWSKVRAVGNLLRHEYDRIDIGRVWLMVEDDLPPLKAAVQTALKQLREREDEDKESY
jgi:uncharacterized protein with HEPN domain